MIEYIPNYSAPDRPYICKKFTATSGEEVHTAININNIQERENLSIENIYDHMENVLKYIEDSSKTLQMIQMNENTGTQPWPIKNRTEIEWSKDEAIYWWQYIYYKDNPGRVSDISLEVNPEELVVEHTHDEDLHTDQAQETSDLLTSLQEQQSSGGSNS